MKRNAIARIIIWCLVLVILLGLLAAGMLYPVYRRQGNSTVSAELIPESTSPKSRISATVAEETWLYASPSLEANKVQSLPQGTELAIAKHESIMGQDWAFVDSPGTGWVPMDDLTVAAESEISENPGTQATPEIYLFRTSEITKIEINWLSGSIQIRSDPDALGIEVQETNLSDSRYPLVCSKENCTLKIDFCEDSLLSRTNLKKDLILLLPPDFSLDSLEVDAASATLEVKDLTIRDVEVDSASGECHFDGCTVEQLDVDTASGDIRFQGSLDVLDCEGASASIYAVLDNVPSRISVDTMSGDLDLTLPENAGYTLKLDAMGSAFRSDFDTTLKNGQHISGDGSCRIDVNAMSGDVTIRKAAAS